MADDGSLNIARERLASPQGKLLVIQTAFLGDAVLVMPLLRAAGRSFPAATVKCLAIPQCAEVLQADCDEVITFDKRDRAALKQEWKQLLEKLRRERFDAALLPHRSLRSGFAAWKAGIPVRIGFDRGGGALFHTHRVRYQPERYEGLRNLDLLEVLTPPADDGFPRLRPTLEDREVVERVLADLDLSQGRYCVVAPGSVWRSKRWLPKHYWMLAEKLKTGHGIETLAVGGPGDETVCAASVLRGEFNLAGRLKPLQSAALMEGARFVVSGDTAPAHLATAVGARQVIIFGSTAPRFGFLPPTESARAVGLDLACRPCTGHGRNCCPAFGNFACLEGVTPESVAAVLGDWLD